MISQYKPLRGGSYFPLLDNIEHAQACMNIKHEDHACFEYSVQCVVYDIIDKTHPERMYRCTTNDTIYCSTMKFPIKLYS